MEGDSGNEAIPEPRETGEALPVCQGASTEDVVEGRSTVRENHQTRSRT